ncbi:MAG: hypothetical protein JNM17_00700 [Archangium sp.]|nr:hypothetical protein [Archangium sp.]
MFRIAPALVLALSACQTTTRSAPPPKAAWEAPLAAGTPISIKASTETTEALVFDFPKHRLVGLSGKTNTWLRWLDERAPKASIESLPNVGAEGAVAVGLKVGDGIEVVCTLDPAKERTILPPSIFDSKLLEGVPPSGPLNGVSLGFGQSQLGSYSVSLEAGVCTIGADVLSKVVVLLAVHGRQPLLFLVEHE